MPLLTPNSRPGRSVPPTELVDRRPVQESLDGQDHVAAKTILEEESEREEHRGSPNSAVIALIMVKLKFIINQSLTIMGRAPKTVPLRHSVNGD